MVHIASDITSSKSHDWCQNRAWCVGSTSFWRQWYAAPSVRA